VTEGSAQYDRLGHVRYGGKTWNGYDARTTIGGLDEAGVEPIAQRGVVGRAVLLDMARFRGRASLDKSETFTRRGRPVRLPLRGRAARGRQGQRLPGRPRRHRVGHP
jgi:hypothetical protein